MDRRGLLATALVLGSVLELVSLASLAVLPPEFQAFGQGLAKVLSNGALWPAVARLVPVSRFGCAFSVIVLARKLQHALRPRSRLLPAFRILKDAAAAAENVAMTLGPPLSGMLRDSAGNYGPVMVGWVVMTALGTVCSLFLRWDDRSRRDRRLERPPTQRAS